MIHFVGVHLTRKNFESDFLVFKRKKEAKNEDKR